MPLHTTKWCPRVSKGSIALPPILADEGKAKEAIEKEQRKRQRSIVTIEIAGPIEKPFGRTHGYDDFKRIDHYCHFDYNQYI